GDRGPREPRSRGIARERCTGQGRRGCFGRGEGIVVALPLTGATQRPPARGQRLSALERCLALFTEVRAGEGPTGVWMLLSVFLVLAAYYFVKPARDGLLAVSPAGALSEIELKAYSSFAQSICVLAALPLYDRVAKSLRRRTLISVVTLFFAANLVVFWALQPGLLFDNVGYVGIA